MYLQHFALSRFPFHSELPADQLFRSRACQETAARLLSAITLFRSNPTVLNRILPNYFGWESGSM